MMDMNSANVHFFDECSVNNVTGNRNRGHPGIGNYKALDFFCFGLDLCFYFRQFNDEFLFFTCHRFWYARIVVRVLYAGLFRKRGLLFQLY